MTKHIIAIILLFSFGNSLYAQDKNEQVVAAFRSILGPSYQVRYHTYETLEGKTVPVFQVRQGPVFVESKPLLITNDIDKVRKLVRERMLSLTKIAGIDLRPTPKINIVKRNVYAAYILTEVSNAQDFGNNHTWVRLPSGEKLRHLRQICEAWHLTIGKEGNNQQLITWNKNLDLLKGDN